MSPALHTPNHISAWLVELPLVRQFISATTDVAVRRVIVVRCNRGNEAGWGEAAPVPGHSTETVDQIWNWLIREARDSGLEMPAASSGVLAATFAQAEADLAAQSAGEPLWRYLGGSTPVWASAAIGLDSDHRPDDRQLRSASEQGYRHMKLKIDRRTNVADVAAVLHRHPEVTFGADANGSLDLEDRAVLDDFDALGLAYLEQPGRFDNYEGHRRLRKNMTTPIALDETAASPAAIDRILAEGAADIVNLKAGRFGTESTLRLAKMISGAGYRVRLGGLIESGIGRAHTVALATHEVFTETGDIAASDRYFIDDLVRPQWTLVDGQITPPPGVGIGVTVANATLDRFATATMTVD
ncbi:MAG: hypothetical protein GY788_10670 [bacterium]|nr:hypothetical protein [bacterium]